MLCMGMISLGEGGTARSRSSLWQCPWLSTDNLAFAVGPEVDNNGDSVIDGRVGALIQQGSSQCRQWKKRQAQFEAAMKTRPGKESQWPLPRQHDEAEY